MGKTNNTALNKNTFLNFENTMSNALIESFNFFLYTSIEEESDLHLKNLFNAGRLSVLATAEDISVVG